MSSAVKPMLAATWGEDVEKLAFPAWGSPKLDGIRALIVNGAVQARSGDLIRHPLVQQMFGRPELEGLDGELAIGPTNAHNLMQVTQKVCGKSATIDPATLTYNVFDCHDIGTLPYTRRLESAMKRIQALPKTSLTTNVQLVPHKLLRSAEEWAAAEAAWLDEGFEGMMINLPDAPYKYGGRCGKKQPWLIKVKRFVDDEGIVLELLEQQHNANEQQRDELGHAYRSTSKAGMVGAKTLGKMRVRCTTGKFAGVVFDLGAGAMDHAMRQKIWDNPKLALEKQVTFKHFDQVGAKDAPRFPIWKSFRAPGT
jgi:DNA ligase-1